MTLTNTDIMTKLRKQPGLTESEKYDLLRSDRRRLALSIFNERSPPLDLEDLAEEIAAREAITNHVGRETINRVKNSLHHNHLPKMDELGVLDYDSDSQQVSQVL